MLKSRGDEKLLEKGCTNICTTAGYKYKSGSGFAANKIAACVERKLLPPN